jgi:hypothetical protein
MKLVDSFEKYPRATVQNFIHRIESIANTIMEGDAVLIKELEEPTPGEELDNLIHVDFRPMTEYKRMRADNMELTIPGILEVYDNWVDTFWELAKKNVGQYNNPQVVKHILEHRKIVETFGNFFHKEE